MNYRHKIVDSAKNTTKNRRKCLFQTVFKQSKVVQINKTKVSKTRNLTVKL